MDVYGETMKDLRVKIKNAFYFLSSVFCLLFLDSCAIAQYAKSLDNKIEILQKKEATKVEVHGVKPSNIVSYTPELIPFKEDISPIDTKSVSISARNTPLRDVLYTIAEAVNINLVMERGVNPETPITMTLNNITAAEALKIISDSVGYFYSIKDNILIIKAMETKIFEISHPAVVHEYQTDVGGDILGGASDGGQSSIKGNVSIKSSADKVSFQFWDALEDSLKNILSSNKEAGFTINRMAGTIMVTASKKELQQVDDYFNNLKKVLNRQVFVEARIVEVQLSEGLKYGIDWSLIKNVKGLGNVTVGPNRFSEVVDTSGPNFQITVTGTDFTALLTALQKQGDVRTLSNPRINILNGQTALLSVGRNTSFISKVETMTTTTTGSAPTTTFTIETKSILSGIVFGLAPYIDGEGKITLTITPIISNLVQLQPQTLGNSGNGIEIKLPTVDLREMSSMVKISEGEMVVIGGLIDRKEVWNENKVPVLGSIPVIGHLFKNVEKSEEKTELVIMLMPRIVSN